MTGLWERYAGRITFALIYTGVVGSYLLSWWWTP